MYSNIQINNSGTLLQNKNLNQAVTFCDVVVNRLPLKINFESIPVDPFWNLGAERELKIHKIHSYPARFPSFITTRAIEYARINSIEPKRMADIFCGCGTAAFEAKRNDIDFWGCDINPVATLIARVKSHKYQRARLDKYYLKIVKIYASINEQEFNYETANERIKYWFDEEHYLTLSRLKKAIENSVPRSGLYREFFICAFSNILKPTSRWLTKSIKSQVDPNKTPSRVFDSFTKQVEFMIEANEQAVLSNLTEVDIKRGDILDPVVNKPKVDLIVTSPPYVTSYDYAELHQLSSLWLGYVNDYRDLRKGSIGRTHNESFPIEISKLNPDAYSVVEKLETKSKQKARDVARYFTDIQQTASLSYTMLKDPGMAVFVIGNTEFKGVKIDNARHLTISMLESGFSEVHITKRKISGKSITPYRDGKGRFTRDSKGKSVYAEEFIVIGVK